MNQHNLQQIIRQQQKQLIVIQAQIQALLVRGVREAATEESNTGSYIEVAKPLGFNREASKVGGFITVCRLYLRIRIRETIIEEQIQLVLSYI